MSALRQAGCSGYQITAFIWNLNRNLRCALDDKLLEYLGVFVRQLKMAGIDHGYTPELLRGALWSDLHKVLCPHGRLFVPQNVAGRFVECGSLHRVRADAGEEKRRFARPESVGQRLGRAIVETWIKCARAMNLRTPFVKAFAVNRDPMHLFDSLDLEGLARHPKCAELIETDPYINHVQHDPR